MRSKNMLWPLVGSMTLVMAGCGQHLEKKHETLVSPSQEGTQAQREPEGRVHHGEAPSDVKP